MGLSFCFGQTSSADISGRVIDSSDGAGLPGATVLMINIKDSLKSKFDVTDVDGYFKIKKAEQAFYRLNISSLGYKPSTKILRVTGVMFDLGTLALERNIELLNEIEIKGDLVPMEMKGDTIQYNAQAFKTNPDASAADLVSKIPGIVVDNTGVTSNGESIEQVLLDGKRFFGQDPLLSLNNIPAEIVNQIQVYGEQSDQSRFTGFNDGNTTKTMNVVTKEDRRNGQFGNVYGGYGTNDLYKAGFTINSFNKDQRFTVLGISNNINQQNFSNQDLAGIGGGGRGGSRSGASESIMTGTLSGITTTHSLGINYSDNWKENTKVEGSYFYNQTDNTNNQNTYRESFLTNETQFYNEEKKSSAHNLNHRLNFRIDHKINENNNILLRSTSGYQDNNSLEKTIGIATNESGEVLNETRNNYSSINTAWNISNNMTYQHKFNKIGRTISVDFGGKINPIERRNSFQALEVDSLIDFNTEEIRNTLNSNITYTEPIGNTALLSASYDLKTNKRKAIKDTYLFEGNNEEGRLIPELSSHFSSGYTTQVSSVSYANRKYGNFINASLSYQNAQLNSEQVFPETSKINTPFNNLLASVMGRFELNENTNAFLRYRTTTDEPSISQLQTVIDNTNPLFISVGNLALKQSYSHDLMLRFSTNNIDKNITFSNFTNIKNTLNYITNSTIILKSDSALQGNVIVQSGAQISQPVNLNGYWNVRNSSTLGVLISPIKTNLNTTMGLGYSRLPGLTNEIKNLSNTYSADWRIGLSSNISENFDFNIFYNAKGNRVINSIQNGKNTNYVTQTIGGKMNIILAKNYVFRSDIYHLDYNGVNQNSDTKYTLWNMSLARKFLKNNMGEMAFTVFDLLGENQSINQKVTASYLEETQTKVLQRYFMFTFTYKLRKFKSAS
jgi:hypothetical protein